MQILSGDIGGTHSRLEVFQTDGTRLVSMVSDKYENHHFDSFVSLLEAFLRAPHAVSVDIACFAVAGPVEAGRCQLTNLAWSLDAAQLAAHFAWRQCHLLNDFAAIPYGIGDLSHGDVLSLQAGERIGGGVITVLGPGTGLGQAMAITQGQRLQVLATEAGHADFAPGSTRQALVVEQLRKIQGPVSCESVLSGRGLVTLYRTRAMLANTGDSAPQLYDAAQQIALAAEQGDALAREAVDLFFEMLGSYMGNVALQTLPRGGLYVAGGIVPKLQKLMDKERLLHAYRDKERMQDLLCEIPIDIILNEGVARLGAARYALSHLRTV